MNRLNTLVFIALLALPWGTAPAAERTIETADGTEIPIGVYEASGSSLIIWLPSEFGVSQRRLALAGRLAAQGIEMWLPDLHSPWFLPVGRYSLNDVPPATVSAIVAEALARTDKDIYLMAGGRGVALALNSVREWQRETNDTRRLIGLVAFSPQMLVRTPQGGETAEYLPVTRATNMPIYIFQPRNAGGYWRSGNLFRELEQGGAPVYLHQVPEASDGFHTRSDSTDSEDAITTRLPGMLATAMSLLASHGGTPQEPVATDAQLRSPERPSGSQLLKPVATPKAAPALQLPSLRGADVDLASLRGKVVLVNFWATWCPPCVEEIPSLQRLYREMHPQGVEILAVDVGESVAKMEKFLRDKPIDFPVLMDEDGEALRRWGVHAFPTTLVLDRDHVIRYAVFGAFDWSSQEVIDTVSLLLQDAAEDGRNR